MKIYVGKTAGFCYGVKRAVDGAEQVISKEKNIYCLGEIVHNKKVVEELKKQGMHFIDKIEDGNNKVIVRAHGIEKNIYEIAKKMNIELIDLTCPNVLKIHETAEEYANKGYFIFLIGKKNHPEIVGTVSYCGENLYIVEEIADVENAINTFNNTGIKKALIIAQTTYSLEVFKKISFEIETKIDNEVKLEIKNTICPATKLRQEETIDLSQNVDIMIIVGGKHSSNTNKLYDEAIKHCKAMLIENCSEIDENEIKKYEKIGIMAGASTPKKSIDEVIEFIQNL